MLKSEEKSNFNNIGINCVTNYLIKSPTINQSTIYFQFESVKIEFCKEYLTKHNVLQSVNTTICGFLFDKFQKFKETSKFTIDYKSSLQ